MSTRGDRQLRAIQQAKQLAALGARLKTIHIMTGLPPRQVQRLFFPDARTIPRGRAPDSAEWYHGTNLILRTDACLIGAKYRQLRNQGLTASEALILAYRAYQSVTQPPYRISLDRAFNLVSYVDGIWLTHTPTLSVLTCPGCGCEFIAAIGTTIHPGEACPFCKLLERFHVDHRIQASYPARPVINMAERQLGMLALFHKLSFAAESDTPAE
ncbi:FlhC family transcriptional regulator [Dechloromonas agitata]|uniref:FlhC family transcriptional regulator n=1 Tax=Dechloromonas agitata TaxID=73030 RepID=UPI00237EA8DB|nr:FlhC family transcriptional regulator [Dechloromonas agitata]MDE1543973.1 FlhC family transcriptional regulator [Dechloromonas agitata]